MEKPACQGGGRSKLPQMLQAHLPVIMRAAEICQRVVAAAEAWPASAPSTNTNGRLTARHAMLNRRLAVKSVPAQGSSAPRTQPPDNQRLFRGPQQIRRSAPLI